MLKSKTSLFLICLFVGYFAIPCFAAPIELMSASGSRVRPLNLQGQKAGVYIFIAHDCPIANSYAPEINRIVKKYTPQKIAFYIIYTEADTPITELKAHAKSYAYNCPALFDRKHELVLKTGAKVTPEAVVITQDGKIAYRGRIDDRNADFGKMKQEASVHDLREALDSVVHDKIPPHKSTLAIGCFIPPLK